LWSMGEEGEKEGKTAPDGGMVWSRLVRREKEKKGKGP